jgi:hypothetical protein
VQNAHGYFVFLRPAAHFCGESQSDRIGAENEVFKTDFILGGPYEVEHRSIRVRPVEQEPDFVVPGERPPAQLLDFRLDVSGQGPMFLQTSRVAYLFKLQHWRPVAQMAWRVLAAAPAAPFQKPANVIRGTSQDSQGPVLFSWNSASMRPKRSLHLNFGMVCALRPIVVENALRICRPSENRTERV